MPFRSKLERIMLTRGIKQVDLHDMIEKKTGKVLSKSTISKIVSGGLIDYHLRTAGYIAFTLDVTIDDIAEDEILKPDPDNVPAVTE